MAGTAAAVRGQLGALDGVAAGAGAKMGGAMGGGLLAGAKKFVPAIAGVFAVAGIADLAGTTFQFFDEAVSAASNLAESGNAVKVSFGAAASEIEKLGETSAERLGLSRRQFNEIATRFSGFASTIAGQGGNVASVIDTLSTRGADFASVFNLEVADALTLFQSGLAGETEPLRRYGIDLSAATVEAFAHANGIGAVGRELTETEKVQARYLLLLQETDKTAGDFANTADGLANSQRTLNAKWEDANAKLGEGLLPLWQDFTDFMITSGIPMFEDMVELLGPGFKTAVGAFAIGVFGLKVSFATIQSMIDLANAGLRIFLGLMGVVTGSKPSGPNFKIPTSGVLSGGRQVPGAASGAFVPRQLGGATVQVGEGRTDEVVLPLRADVLAEIGRNIPGNGGGAATFVLYDADGELIGRMRGEARQELDSAISEAKTSTLGV